MSSQGQRDRGSRDWKLGRRGNDRVSGEQGSWFTCQIGWVVDDETGGAREMLGHGLLVASDHVHHVDTGGVPV